MVWQRSGTVAVQNGSTTVTGTNVDFAASSRVGDSFVGPDGATYEVANVASATVISILPAYKGPTASGAAYAIMPVQGYDKMLSDAFNNLNNQFGPKLAALGTTGNYDVLPVEKGGTGKTTPLGSSANATLTASADDQTAGRVLKVGDAGINAPLKGRVSTNPTDILLTGRGWDFSMLASNTPPGSQDGALLSMNYGIPDIYAVQLFGDWRQNALKIRSVVNSGAPTAWATIYTTQNTTRASDGTLKAI